MSLLVAACTPWAPTSLSTSLPDGGSITPPDDDSSAPPGACGGSCDPTTSCQPGLSCLPSTGGRTVCKPSGCPVCPEGQYCAYTLSTCTTNGNCSSFACGWDFSGACDDCTKASSCCASLLACSDTPACRALVECTSGCNGAQSCLSACGQVAGQTAIDQYNAAFGCADSQCGAQCGGMMDAGMLPDEGTLPEAAPPEDASEPELCDPPCLSSETCSKLSPLANPSCNGNQCVHVTCPTSLSCGGDSFDPGCTAYGETVEYGAVCGASATGRDPNVETCMVGPANTMHCDFPEGSVDCPALWENLTGQVPEYTYTAGCCGAVPTVPATPLPYCGIPGDDGNAPICAPVTAGVGGWMPAP